jgi:hypothetical protein
MFQGNLLLIQCVPIRMFLILQQIENKEGISISSWWLPHEKNKGTILLIHGFAMNKSHMLPGENLL